MTTFKQATLKRVEPGGNPQERNERARATVQAKVRRAISAHIGAVLARRDINRVADALVAMFARSLGAICSITRYEDSPEFRQEARALLPRAAGEALLRELRESGELPALELAFLSQAIGMMCFQRGVGSWPEVIENSVPLSHRLDSAAAKALFDWSANPPASPDGLTLIQIDLLFALRPELDKEELIEQRRAELDRFRNRLKKLKVRVSIPRFAKQAGTTKTSFYANWLGGVWPDNSEEGMRILLALAAPAEYWAERSY